MLFRSQARINPRRQHIDQKSAADFGKLSWNSAHNDGDSFRFVALDANRKPILGADS